MLTDFFKFKQNLKCKYEKNFLKNKINQQKLITNRKYKKRKALIEAVV